MGTIFYGMSGEGRGHATRVRTVVENLKDEHDIFLFAPFHAYDLLSNAYKDTNVHVINIRGLNFYYSRGRLSYFKTCREGTRYLLNWRKLASELDEYVEQYSPDLVITDFEPSLPRAARRHNIPFVSLDHQHFLVVSDLSGLPGWLYNKTRTMSYIVKKYYSGQADTIVSSFYFPPLKPEFSDVIQAGVMLRPEVISAKQSHGDHLLCYIRRFASENILRTLRSCNRDVYIYGLGEKEQDGNLLYRPISIDGFLHDLATCHALICNAGNQLVGEAIYLKKPVLAMPEALNFEQYINAHYLQASGAGDWCRTDDFSPEVLQRFLDRAEDFRGNSYPERVNGNTVILDALRKHLPVSRTSGKEPVLLNAY